MEKEKLYMNAANAMPPTWNLSNFGMEIQSNELNFTSEQLPSYFFNPNWESSVDQSDPFESAMSSIVSSPAASSAGNGVESVVLRELIGRLGNICNSAEISPESYVGGNNSTNASCYSTPLNSPPKLNLSMMDHQIRRNLPIPGNHLPSNSNLAPFSTDSGFSEKAARFSCFGSRNFSGLNGQFGLNESEYPQKLTPGMEFGKLSRVSSNQSIELAGSPMGVQENRDGLLKDGISASEKKFRRLSRPSTPENGEFGDSKEESSVSEQIPGGEIAMKVQNDANARKRKSITRGKAKENPSSPKVAAENEESNAKKSKSEEANGNDQDAAKTKAQKNASGKAADQKQNEDSAKPPEPPKDYIHVRARRGQATDSHSLAERVRREKISERMKFLQDLVPGCNKVTGKAVMLDEIINYVQSLQRQVEVNSDYPKSTTHSCPVIADLSDMLNSFWFIYFIVPFDEISNCQSKDGFQHGSSSFKGCKSITNSPIMEQYKFKFYYNFLTILCKFQIFQSRRSMPHNLYPLDTPAPTFLHGYQSQQGPSLHSGISNGTETPYSVNSLNGALRRNPSIQLPPIDGFGEAASQVSAFWEDDLQSFVQMGFGQTQPDSFPGTVATTQMKIEL
ncbi:hypothetical protein F0562_000017 [Nyssa sinensis]|uniref:BHLH domain-containing protein n=1 Tax=Nyssa sinensis TaxID=561372 RepID=A0A5J5BYR4_9ASTE|nr:hypothetical protein F0562_000017 [Nyssa sinensis]